MTHSFCLPPIDRAVCPACQHAVIARNSGGFHDPRDVRGIPLAPAADLNLKGSPKLLLYVGFEFHMNRDFGLFGSDKINVLAVPRCELDFRRPLSDFVRIKLHRLFHCSSPIALTLVHCPPLSPHAPPPFPTHFPS